MSTRTRWIVNEELPEVICYVNSSRADVVARYVPDSTCMNISEPPSGFLCSECRWGDFAEPTHLLTTSKFTGNDSGPNYCPNCGAKVVKS